MVLKRVGRLSANMVRAIERFSDLLCKFIINTFVATKVNMLSQIGLLQLSRSQRVPAYLLALQVLVTNFRFFLARQSLLGN
jgi:hypothetical protein